VKTLVVALAPLLAVAALPASALDITSPIAAGTEPPAPWHLVGLPQQSKPFTQFSLVDLDGRHVLRVEADHAYGNLVHPLPRVSANATLSWRWRVDQPVRGADLHKRSGEDSALKVCASFDLATDRVPFLERQWLALMQTRSSEKLPTATLCYVWDTTLPDRSLVVSPFTRRIRSVTLRGGELGQWSSHTQDLAADFMRAFGDEAPSVPPLIAVAVGADSDNTASHSVGYVADIHLNETH
jgi:hypothetical protein